MRPRARGRHAGCARAPSRRSRGTTPRAASRRCTTPCACAAGASGRERCARSASSRRAGAGMWARLRELWRYRELIRNLVERDLKVRYKNSVLGIAWSWLNPFLMMIVLTVVFEEAARNGHRPAHLVVVLPAILAWNFFAASVV